MTGIFCRHKNFTSSTFGDSYHRNYTVSIRTRNIKDTEPKVRASLDLSDNIIMIHTVRVHHRLLHDTLFVLLLILVVRTKEMRVNRDKLEGRIPFENIVGEEASGSLGFHSPKARDKESFETDSDARGAAGKERSHLIPINRSKRTGISATQVGLTNVDVIPISMTWHSQTTGTIFSIRRLDTFDGIEPTVPGFPDTHTHSQPS